MSETRRLDRRFDYAYRYTPQRWGSKEHVYEVVGRDGAIQFHVTDLQRFDASLPQFSGGLEVHRRTCPPSEDKPPSHRVCPLLGGPCWHDGTSSYASDVLIPRWELDFPDHDAVFRWLGTEYDKRFTAEMERER